MMTVMMSVMTGFGAITMERKARHFKMVPWLRQSTGYNHREDLGAVGRGLLQDS